MRPPLLRQIRFVALFLFISLPCSIWATPLQITFFDVGQGDAILFKCKDKSVLIDAGRNDDIVEKLKNRGVNKLEFLVASLNHVDHIGGMDAILERMKVISYLDNDHPTRSQTHEKIIGLVRSKKIQHFKPNTRIMLLNGVKFKTLPPPMPTRNQNNSSIGLIVEYKGYKSLFTGDSEVEEIKYWLDKNFIPEVDVLKASHHGSRNGLTPELLFKAKPKVVVISVSDDNEYGHPHDYALKYYRTANRTVLRTDEDGDIEINVDDNGRFNIITSKSNKKFDYGFKPTLVKPIPAQNELDQCKEFNERQRKINKEQHMKTFGCPPCPCSCNNGKITCAPCARCVPKRNGHNQADLLAPEPIPNDVKPTPEENTCCHVCKTSKACGDRCIPESRDCTKPKGCACDG